MNIFSQPEGAAAVNGVLLAKGNNEFIPCPSPYYLSEMREDMAGVARIDKVKTE